MKRLLLVLAVALCFAQPVSAQPIITRFSDWSSDSTPVGVLDAEVTFTKFGSTLGLTLNNLSNYSIAQLYFNTDPSLLGLTFDDSFFPVNPTWSIVGTGLTQDFGANGFGKYNYKLDFGSGSDRLAPGSITDIEFTMTGDTSLSGIGSTWSTNPPGSISAIAAMKFEAGPYGDSAFGATRSVLCTEEPPFGNPPPAVPEPTSLALLTTGGLGLALAAWRRRRARLLAVA